MLPARNVTRKPLLLTFNFSVSLTSAVSPASPACGSRLSSTPRVSRTPQWRPPPRRHRRGCRGRRRGWDSPPASTPRLGLVTEGVSDATPSSISYRIRTYSPQSRRRARTSPAPSTTRIFESSTITSWVISTLTFYKDLVYFLLYVAERCQRTQFCIILPFLGVGWKFPFFSERCCSFTFRKFYLIFYQWNKSKTIATIYLLNVLVLVH